MYLHRTLESYIKTTAAQFPVVLLTGARQVGKTTLLKYLCSGGRTYVTLDDPLVLNFAREEPALFFQRYTGQVLIDEIQYAPQLLPYIKMEVDRKRTPNRFWLTGSQQLHLMKGLSESLAGRVGIVTLMGLSRREVLSDERKNGPFLPQPDSLDQRLATGGVWTLKDIYRCIWRGSFPAIVLNKDMDRNLFFSSYVQTYLQRDIRDLAQVGDKSSFLRFLRGAAARTGRLLNMAELARDADIAPNTAKQWLSILKASGIVYLLEPYHTNIVKRLVKTPKLYMLDTGLCAYLTEWSSPETLEAGAMSGAILETWIMAELLKSYWHNGLHAPFYYYRDKDQKEIDLLIVKDGVIHPLEFKKTASPSKDDIRHFKVLQHLNMPVGEGGILCLAAQSLPLSDSIRIIPVSAL